jgi:ABC-type glycerol-3-phosphate transport system substrate-binding protein
LQLLRQEPGLKAAPIPAANGNTISLLNGWMWVVVTSDPDKQGQVLQLLDALMLPENQSAFARTIHMLPSARQVLLNALPDNVDKTLYESLLENAVLPLSEGDGGTLARSLQDAFTAVISGTKTAAGAAAAIQSE